MIRLLTLIALLPAFVPLSAAEAQDDWYDIEFIIFEHKAPPGAAAELWTTDPGAPAFDQAVELAPPPGETPQLLSELRPLAEVRMPYQKLDVSELKLEQLVNRLTVSGIYAPLLHVAWRQPASTGQPVRSVRIHTPPSRQASGPVLLSDTQLIDTLSVGEPTPPAAVDGIISLQRNRFLHINLDLLLSEPAAEAARSGVFSIFNRQESRPKVFRLQGQRRIRVNEVHYFDHPVIGVIVQVTPYAAQE